MLIKNALMKRFAKKIGQGPPLPHLDKIQKNSSFSSGDLPIVASRGVPCTTPRPSALQNRTESSGRADWERELGGRASEGALSRTRREQMVQGGGKLYNLFEDIA